MALTIPARDGRPLAASESGEGDDWVVVAGAMGVRRAYYRRFAERLAARGHRVLTFDYRGIGGSRAAPQPLRAEEATIMDWGEKDVAGVLDHVAAQEPDSVALVGHSVGGQIWGLADNAGVADRAVLVAAQSGDVRLWPWPERAAVSLLWWGVIPATTAGGRPFPARRLGMGEDLPPRVAKQWAAWARSRDYMWRDATLASRYSRITSPILSVSIEDDRMYGPVRATRALAAKYGGPVEHRVLRPADVGRKRVGHFGVFRPGVEAAWDAWSDWSRAPVTVGRPRR